MFPGLSLMESSFAGSMEGVTPRQHKNNKKYGNGDDENENDRALKSTSSVNSWLVTLYSTSYDLILFAAM